MSIEQTDRRTVRRGGQPLDPTFVQRNLFPVSLVNLAVRPSVRPSDGRSTELARSRFTSKTKMFRLFISRISSMFSFYFNLDLYLFICLSLSVCICLGLFLSVCYKVASLQTSLSLHCLTLPPSPCLQIYLLLFVCLSQSVCLSESV